MKKISGLIITENSSSKRIIDIKIKDKLINELINLFLSYTHLKFIDLNKMQPMVKFK